MTDIPPLQFDWDGEHMIPLRPAAADKFYVVGERYRMVPVEERSMRSHSHYFACVNEAWRNLPEIHSDRFPTAKHLRKWALIKAGYREERSFVAHSKAEAVRLAAFVKPIDDYAIVHVAEAVVTVFTAKSQSTRAMKKAEFAKSKEDVLNVLAQVIGTDPTTLQQSSGKKGAA